MAGDGNLEQRVERLERENERLRQQHQELAEVVDHLYQLAPTDMDGTPMSLFEARTWTHPHQAYHTFIGVEQELEDSIDRYVRKQAVIKRVADEHDYSRAKVKARLNELLEKEVLQERDGRIRAHDDIRDIEPEDLFIDNMERADSRRGYAASKGKSVDNPDHKRER